MPVAFFLLSLSVAMASLSLRPAPTVAETVIRLNVQPMAAPKPALRYLLLPELREMTPGNPIPNYVKALLDEDSSNNKFTLNASALRAVDRAARMDKPDWQLLPSIRIEGSYLLLPDLQKLRELASRLQERFRTELAQRRFDDALVTARTMFALSRHLGEHPTLIGDLVAIAIAQVTIAPLEEMLEQPGCPNLYWALTNLPSPLISLATGVEGERMLTRADLRDLDDVNPMSPAQLKKLIAHVEELRKFEEGPRKGKRTREWLNARTRDVTALSAARARLIESGMAEEKLRSIPAEQIALLDERREYEIRRDETMKLMNLSTWQFEELYAALKPASEPGLFDFMVSRMLQVRRAQGRLEQRIALLRHVEALRLYAADHDGQLPAKLAAVAIPLPVDPFTGKPFRYEVQGETAHLRGSPPRGMEDNPAYNLHYEVTIKKP